MIIKVRQCFFTK